MNTTHTRTCKTNKQLTNVSNSGICQKTFKTSLIICSQCSKQYRTSRHKKNNRNPLNKKFVKRAKNKTRNQTNNSNFWNSSKKKTGNRWRTFVNVWYPRMKWKNIYFKKKARNYKNNARDNADNQIIQRKITQINKKKTKSLKLQSSGITIKNYTPEQEKTWTQSTENKIFKTSFRWKRWRSTKRSQNLKNQRLQFKGKIKRQQVRRTNKQQYTKNRKKNQKCILKRVNFVLP